jgi:hypothetical protein
MACGGGSTDAVTCAPLPSMRFALTLRLQDSITRSPALRNVSVVVLDGDFRQTMHFETIDPTSSPAGDIDLAPDRPGVYTAVVTADGYDPWTKVGIVSRVGPGGCGLATDTITALLRPLR